MVSGHRSSIVFNLYCVVSDNVKWHLFRKISLKCDRVFSVQLEYIVAIFNRPFNLKSDV